MKCGQPSEIDLLHFIEALATRLLNYVIGMISLDSTSKHKCKYTYKQIKNLYFICDKQGKGKRELQNMSVLHVCMDMYRSMCVNVSDEFIRLI